MEALSNPPLAPHHHPTATLLQHIRCACQQYIVCPWGCCSHACAPASQPNKAGVNVMSRWTAGDKYIVHFMQVSLFVQGISL